MQMEEWKSQIKRGTLEYGILLLIRRQPIYGYAIISALESSPILAARENTIYPLLRRLEKEGHICSTWQESSQGLPPRKYYQITPAGEGYLAAMTEQWEALLAAIDALKGDTVHG